MMFKTMLKLEFKNIFRDPLYLFFVFFSVFIGLLGYFAIPYLQERVSTTSLLPEIIATILILLTGYIFGAITAFTLLDDLDDNVLLSLKITPVSAKVYVSIKLIISYIFAFIATFFIIIATDFLPTASLLTIIIVAILGAFQAPSIALIITSFSDNKVEGFVTMKLSGILLAFPVLAFFIQPWQELFISLAPGFWPARIIQMVLIPQMSVNFNIATYFVIGGIYNLFFICLLLKIYFKRTNI